MPVLSCLSSWEVSGDPNDFAGVVRDIMLLGQLDRATNSATAGRPLMLQAPCPANTTLTVHDFICKKTKQGLTLGTIAPLAGVREGTIRKWLRLGRDVQQQIETGAETVSTVSRSSIVFFSFAVEYAYSLACYTAKLETAVNNSAIDGRVTSQEKTTPQGAVFVSTSTTQTGELAHKLLDGIRRYDRQHSGDDEDSIDISSLLECATVEEKTTILDLIEELRTRTADKKTDLADL